MLTVKQQKPPTDSRTYCALVPWVFVPRLTRCTFRLSSHCLVATTMLYALHQITTRTRALSPLSSHDSTLQDLCGLGVIFATLAD
ncbi:unnamed protein product [Periconia digitata]|uniref:Uncharacterized protein n=1 Tax=Periconia digitata TaxID=1303443 RepID=A0A9W4UKL0_9PLEO|nr:unnamed protein product [Periconia digitata]